MFFMLVFIFNTGVQNPDESKFASTRFFNFFKIFVFFIGLITFGFIYIDLVASYCVVQRSKIVRVVGL